MNKQFNIQPALVVMLLFALVVMALGALTLSAGAQAPPGNLDMLSVWSSRDGELYAPSALTSHALDELTSVRWSNPVMWQSGAWSSQDLLSCEPQRTISTTDAMLERDVPRFAELGGMSGADR